MKNSLVSTAALLALAAGATAQTVPLSGDFQPVPGQVREAVLHYASGTITVVDAADATHVGANATSTLAYDNTCTSGFFTSRPVGQEVFDWGIKSAGLSTIVDSFRFGYATGEPDASIGGAGASIDIAFFEGTGLGFGINGAEVARFSFTGLPGATTVGGLNGWIITVDLVGGGEFCLNDGEIGFSYCVNSPTSTGPLIGDIAACPNGQTDAFDVYDCGGDPATYGGTFFFGGSPTATFYMEINEDDGSQAATAFFDVGTGLNQNVMTTSWLPVLGTTWDPKYVDFEGVFSGGNGSGVSTAVWFSGRLPAGAAITAYGEILVDPTSVLLLSDTVPIINYLVLHTVPIPAKDLSLLDLGTVYVQAVRVGGAAPVKVSTLIEATVGF